MLKLSCLEKTLENCVEAGERPRAASIKDAPRIFDSGTNRVRWRKGMREKGRRQKGFS